MGTRAHELAARLCPHELQIGHLGNYRSDQNPSNGDQKTHPVGMPFSFQVRGLPMGAASCKHLRGFKNSRYLV